jgi:hypothetical protein
MPATPQRSWRMRLARELSGWMLVKLGLLTVLWALFFSGSHQCRVDAPTTASRFGLGGNWKTAPGDRCD